MPAIQNQDTGLTHLIVIDGEEITEHNRKFSEIFNQTGSDVDLARGIIKRYIQKNKRTFNLSFLYLPSIVEHTVDGRKAQSYLKEKSNKKGTVSVSLKVDPSEPFKTYTCYFDAYSETLVKRDIATGCSYYDVSITLMEK